MSRDEGPFQAQSTCTPMGDELQAGLECLGPQFSGDSPRSPGTVQGQQRVIKVFFS